MSIIYHCLTLILLGRDTFYHRDSISHDKALEEQALSQCLNWLVDRKVELQKLPAINSKTLFGKLFARLQVSQLESIMN